MNTNIGYKYKNDKIKNLWLSIMGSKSKTDRNKVKIGGA